MKNFLKKYGYLLFILSGIAFFVVLGYSDYVEYWKLKEEFTYFKYFEISDFSRSFVNAIYPSVSYFSMVYFLVLVCSIYLYKLNKEDYKTLIFSVISPFLVLIFWILFKNIGLIIFVVSFIIILSLKIVENKEIINEKAKVKFPLMGLLILLILFIIFIWLCILETLGHYKIGFLTTNLWIYICFSTILHIVLGIFFGFTKSIKKKIIIRKIIFVSAIIPGILFFGACLGVILSSILFEYACFLISSNLSLQ